MATRALALVLGNVPYRYLHRLKTKPKGRACCHMSYNSGPTSPLRRALELRGSEPYLPNKEGSGAATCSTVPDPAFPQRGAPVLPHALGVLLWVRRMSIKEDTHI
jgi:hypothetical protein